MRARLPGALEEACPLVLRDTVRRSLLWLFRSFVVLGAPSLLLLLGLLSLFTIRSLFPNPEAFVIVNPCMQGFIMGLRENLG